MTPPLASPTLALEGAARVLGAAGLAVDQGLSPVDLAYVAAAVLLPLRLLVILRAAAEVPRLHARVRAWLSGGELDVEAALRRSTNPYAELARLLTAVTQPGPVSLEGTLERALRKAQKRGARGQALDAASMVLLVGLSLSAGRGSSLGQGFLGQGPLLGALFIGVMLVCTMVARAALQGRLEAAIRELGDALKRNPTAPSLVGVCAFCGSEVEATTLEVDLDGVPTRAIGALCRECGKLVASLAPDSRPRPLG